MPYTRVVLLTLLALVAFAGNSLLCRAALAHTQIDAASFTSIRLVSGAVVLFGSQSYSQDEQELLEFISSQIAAAIERKQLQDRLSGRCPRRAAFPCIAAGFAEETRAGPC